MIPGVPRRRVPVPAAVQAVAGERPVRLVWENELGGLTYEVGTGSARSFVKWAPTASGIDLTGEAERMTWAAAFSLVPRPLDHGQDETGAWLVTSPVPGRSAVDDRWTADPRLAVTAIGEGLRALHETLPVASCPFTWSAHQRLADASRRACDGLVDPARWHEVHQTLTVEDALDTVAQIPPTDRQVVCHGDACAPNTLLGDDGRWSGHVDLGSLGIADRWADLAIATWSTQWNYGPGWGRLLLDAYGVRPDEDRTRYYRLLWDLGP